jgi:ATP-binding cassette, subfamily F, member 3
MLTVNNISYYIGSRAIYDSASLHIKPKDKIGLIGMNGTGKSTLLHIIVGNYQVDSGRIEKAGGTTIGFLNQDLLSYLTEDSILSVAMQAFERENELQKQIDEILHEMETNYRDELIDKLGVVQDEFETLGGYTIQSRAEEILEGLGFKTYELNQPLQNFSGGWRMRVMLSKLLLQKPSLLLLDEPTNHLDLPSIQWIEKYIANYEGAIVVVSHDREFLNNVSTTIVEVSGAKLNVYSGNYDYYVEEKNLRNEIQKGAYENQQSQIRQTERFIERFKAKATKAKQVQSRVKALNRLDIVDDVVSEAAKVHFKFKFGTQPGRNVLMLEDINKDYGPEKIILRNSSATIERGDKIALIGANGKGKSTVLRIIADTEPIEGSRRTGHNVKFSFYAQHQLESLRVDHEILEELKYADSTKSESELRTILGCFLFNGEEVFKKIKVLSGGEKSRVALAKVLISEANFLLLDEPTNHLDIQSVNILAQALQQYEGTYVVVSHDRHFVSQIANKIWYIEDQEIKEYMGSYDEFVWWQEEIRQNSALAEQVSTPKTAPVKAIAPAPVKPKLNHNDSKKLQKEIEEIEARITATEKLKENIETKLADAGIYSDTALLQKTNAEYEKIKTDLNAANERWEELIMAMEG